MHEPNTTLFSSQSTEAERIVQEDEPNDDDIMVFFFDDLQFDPEEDNVPDNMIMSSIEKQQVERLEFHAKCFEYDIQKLHDVAKEHHELFVEQVKTLKEFVDLKMAEIKSEIKTNIKTELTPILELVLLLPTNAPPAKQVSKTGDKGCGVGTLKDSEKGVVVGKLMST
ncbi:unnamed protein product [Lactuca saligna]|uniref:Uncharacterized protein n=1 Tax=Lactuca saligna TaxID=75948 RepID=A0AA35ZL33_LACSI|nr:unnamed protein product [Lactuca saligna]